MQDKTFSYQKKKASRTVAKAIQTWYTDITYTERARYIRIQEVNKPLEFEMLPINEMHSFTIEHPVIFKLSRKLELATNMNLTRR